MKKRILAAVLAAATAFSMFGASLSASAAIDADGAYAAYDAESYDSIDTAFDTAITAETANETIVALIENAEKIITDTDPDIADGYFYTVDYNYTSTELNTLVKTKADFIAALYAFNGTNYATAETARVAFAAAVKAIFTDAKLDDGVVSAITGVRLTAFNRVQTANNVMKALGDITATHEPDLYEYNLDELQDTLATVVAAVGANYTNTELMDLADSFDVFNEDFALSDYVDETALAKYEAAMDKAYALVDTDYSALNWTRVEGIIAAADVLAAEGKYAEAVAELDKILTPGTNGYITPKTADKTELRAALKALFTTSVVVFPNEYPEAGNALYKKAEYTEKPGYFGNQVTYEYLEFAIGVPYIDANGDEKLGDSYYEKAVAAYKQSSIAQSLVDKALAELEDAVAGLEITNLASEWEIVKLENYLDTATSKFKEGDYRNNAAWKKLVAAIEDAEEILAKAYPGKTEVASATDVLEKFIKGEEAGYKLTANSITSLKIELKNLVRDAKAMLKDTTDKPAAVILGLEKVLATAENVVEKGTLVSTFEDAIASLTSAMDDYTNGIVPDVVTGWYYSDEAKAWFFYKEDGTEMTGWMWDASYNGWYYFREDGTMVEDCSKMIGGTWYYFWKGGKMAASAWAKGLDGKWYYYNASGAMATSSWILSSGKYYYVGSDGAMLVNTTTPDGYKVDANGVWVQ